MSDHMYENRQALDEEYECNAFERYNFEDNVTTKGVRFSDALNYCISTSLSHWLGDITFEFDNDGYIVGYDYWTYEEDEISMCNEIRRDIDAVLSMHKKVQ